MRMFLIGMCDIFLMLYLTAVIHVTPETVLTVGDFYQLKSLHDTLKSDTEKAETALEERLKQSREEKERLLAEKKKQEELAAAKLAEEKARLNELQKSLVLSDFERERISEDLRIKEEMLKNRELLLENLNKEIEAKEKIRRKMQKVYQSELENQREAAQASRQLAKQLKSEAENAQSLADQMKEEVSQAYKTAEAAKAVQQKAQELKEQALKEKEAAQQRAEESLSARKKAEEEKQRALEILTTEKEDKEKAQQNARKLAEAIEDIKQDGEAAYQKNMRPKIQTVNVTYERKTSNNTFVYKRELTLLPVAIGGMIYGVFPSRQIGFNARSDKAPNKLIILYLGQQITNGLVNTEDGLIALSLSEYQGKAETPYPPGTDIAQLMPALLALRNNGNVGLTDKLRGIADDFFIVNRDYLKSDEDGGLKFTVSGWRGTGARAEHIVLGDQLVDLNGRLIGVANETNRVIRINSLNDWAEIAF